MMTVITFIDSITMSTIITIITLVTTVSMITIITMMFILISFNSRLRKASWGKVRLTGLKAQRLRSFSRMSMSVHLTILKP